MIEQQTTLKRITENSVIRFSGRWMRVVALVRTGDYTSVWSRYADDGTHGRFTALSDSPVVTN